MSKPISLATIEKLGDAFADEFVKVLEAGNSKLKGNLKSRFEQFNKQTQVIRKSYEGRTAVPVIPIQERFGIGRTGHKDVVIAFLNAYEPQLQKIALDILSEEDPRFGKSIGLKASSEAEIRKRLNLLGDLIVVNNKAFTADFYKQSFSMKEESIFGYFQGSGFGKKAYANTNLMQLSVDTSRLYSLALIRMQLNKAQVGVVTPAGIVGMNVEGDLAGQRGLRGIKPMLRTVSGHGEVGNMDADDYLEDVLKIDASGNDIVFHGVATGIAGDTKKEVVYGGSNVKATRSGLENALYGLMQWVLLYSRPMVNALFGALTRTELEEKILGEGTEIEIAQKEGVDRDVAEKTGADVAAAKKIDAEDFAAQLRAKKFREQCFLVDHYNILIPKSTERDTFRYFTSLEIEPALAAARISGIPDIKPLLNARNIQFSGLVPKMKFYKMVKKSDATSLMGSALTAAADFTGVLRSINKELKKKKNKKKKSNDYVEYEIPFQSSTSKHTIEEAFAATRGRNDGVGLRSFEYNFIGANSFEIERNIECKMSLFFRNLEDLTTGTTNATFLDLILFGISKKNPQVDESGTRVDFFDPDMKQMKVVVGWEAPNREMQKEIIKDSKLAALIKRSALTLRLTLAKHSINVDNDGGGTVDIEFTGWIESKQRSVDRNLLRFKGENTQEIEAQRKKVKLAEKLVTLGKRRVTKAKKNKADGPLAVNAGPLGTIDFDVFGILSESEFLDAAEGGLEAREDKLRAERQKLQFLQVKEKTAGYNAFLTRILTTGKVYQIDIPVGDPQAPIANSILGMVQDRVVADENIAMKMRMNIPMLSNLNSLIKEVDLVGRGAELRSKLADKTESAVAEAIRRSLPKADAKSESAITDEQFAKMKIVSDPTDPNDRRIYFTFIGDVLQAGFSLFRDNINDTTDDDLRFLFGTIPFYDVRKKAVITTAIVDVPISLNNVVSFWFDKVVRPSTPRYDLRQFIIDVMNDLIVPNFGGACYPVYPQTFNLTPVNSTLEGAARKGKDRVPKTARIRKLSAIQKNPGLSFNDPTPDLFFYNYIYFKGIQNTGPDGISGDVNKDAKNGIYHFFIGADRGLLKRIEFDKIDAPYYREFRTLGDENNISEQLSHPYKANLICIGNNLFRVGMYVYINPRLIAGNPKLQNSLSYKMNLGGYAMVYRVSNLITPGSFETTLECHMLGLTKFSKGAKGNLKSKGVKHVSMTSKSVHERAGTGGAVLEFTEKESKEVVNVKQPIKTPKYVRFKDGGGQVTIEEFKQMGEATGFPEESTYDIIFE